MRQEFDLFFYILNLREEYFGYEFEIRISEFYEIECQNYQGFMTEMLQYFDDMEKTDKEYCKKIEHLNYKILFNCFKHSKSLLYSYNFSERDIFDIYCIAKDNEYVDLLNEEEYSKQFKIYNKEMLCNINENNHIYDVIYEYPVQNIKLYFDIDLKIKNTSLVAETSSEYEHLNSEFLKQFIEEIYEKYLPNEHVDFNDVCIEFSNDVASEKISIHLIFEKIELNINEDFFRCCSQEKLYECSTAFDAQELIMKSLKYEIKSFLDILKKKYEKDEFFLDYLSGIDLHVYTVLRQFRLINNSKENKSDNLVLKEYDIINEKYIDFNSEVDIFEYYINANLDHTNEQLNDFVLKHIEEGDIGKKNKEMITIKHLTPKAMEKKLLREEKKYEKEEEKIAESQEKYKEKCDKICEFFGPITSLISQTRENELQIYKCLFEKKDEEQESREELQMIKYVKTKWREILTYYEFVHIVKTHYEKCEYFDSEEWVNDFIKLSYIDENYQTEEFEQKNREMFEILKIEFSVQFEIFYVRLFNFKLTTDEFYKKYNKFIFDANIKILQNDYEKESEEEKLVYEYYEDEYKECKQYFEHIKKINEQKLDVDYVEYCDDFDQTTSKYIFNYSEMATGKSENMINNIIKHKDKKYVNVIIEPLIELCKETKIEIEKRLIEDGFSDEFEIIFYHKNKNFIDEIEHIKKDKTEIIVLCEESFNIEIVKNLEGQLAWKEKELISYYDEIVFELMQENVEFNYTNKIEIELTYKKLNMLAKHNIYIDSFLSLQEIEYYSEYLEQEFTSNNSLVIINMYNILSEKTFNFYRKELSPQFIHEEIESNKKLIIVSEGSTILYKFKQYVNKIINNNVDESQAQESIIEFINDNIQHDANESQTTDNENDQDFPTVENIQNAHEFDPEFFNEEQCEIQEEMMQKDEVIIINSDKNFKSIEEYLIKSEFLENFEEILNDDNVRCICISSIYLIGLSFIFKDEKILDELSFMYFEKGNIFENEILNFEELLRFRQIPEINIFYKMEMMQKDRDDNELVQIENFTYFDLMKGLKTEEINFIVEDEDNELSNSFKMSKSEEIVNETQDFAKLIEYFEKEYEEEMIRTSKIDDIRAKGEIIQLLFFYNYVEINIQPAQENTAQVLKSNIIGIYMFYELVRNDENFEDKFIELYETEFKYETEFMQYDTYYITMIECVIYHLKYHDKYDLDLNNLDSEECMKFEKENEKQYSNNKIYEKIKEDRKKFRERLANINLANFKILENKEQVLKDKNYLSKILKDYDFKRPGDFKKLSILDINFEKKVLKVEEKYSGKK